MLKEQHFWSGCDSWEILGEGGGRNEISNCVRVYVVGDRCMSLLIGNRGGEDRISLGGR